MGEQDQNGGRDVGGRRGGADLAREAETLSYFKGKIDKILLDLESSPAAKSKIGDQTITRAAYGTGFSAADDLASMYDKVHGRLEKFSQTLGDQLEALGIAVQIADRGYDSIDAKQAARLREIQRRAREEYPATKQGQPADQGTGPMEAGSGETGGSGSDFR
ncbi:hypothetical protein [Streptomyces buecherae]|uniref:Uncharacterized protein n=1 Tax=Streptomyces buecherae TaxID=2763006 RepID=A0A7H8NE25_9ACTN|nr:hypothetical protein [Streptomyces buecherae]QKW52720.1 hypothetical protein HUT08_27835 [Streptomyces buecherae]